MHRNRYSNVNYTYVCTYVYMNRFIKKELAHMIIKLAEKFNNMSSANWEPRKVNGISFSPSMEA